MEIYTAHQAQDKLFKLIDYIAQTHEPVYILGKHNKAVMISEKDYREFLETLHIATIPGLKVSILEGKKLPLEEFTENLNWDDDSKV